MDFGLLCKNDKREYVVLNDVRMAYILLISLVYLPVYISMYCMPIAHLSQNKAFPLLYWSALINIRRKALLSSVGFRKHMTSRSPRSFHM